MMNRRFAVAVLLAVGPSTLARTAHADEDRELEPAAARPTQLHLDAGLGGSSYGLHAGAVALASVGTLRVGATGYASEMFSSKVGGGLAIGVGSHGTKRLTLDLLAELGWNRHRVVKGLLSDDPGSSATIPHAGLLLGARWYLGPATHRTRLTMGLWLSVRHDLDQRRVSYSYTSADWFSGRESVDTSSASVGGLTEVSLRFGIGFDFTP